MSIRRLKAMPKSWRSAMQRRNSMVAIAFAGGILIGLTSSVGIVEAAGLAGDLNGDGSVNVLDLSLLLSQWGKSTTGSTPAPTPSQTPVPAKSSTPAPTPSSTPGAPVSGSFTETKPTLTSPLIVDLPNGGSLTYPDTQDVYIRPKPGSTGVYTKGLTVTGGHNVVIEGGDCQVSGGGCGKIMGQTGTVWVEGQSYGRSDCTTTEGLDIDERKASAVMIMNIKANCLNGSYATNHSDILQDWAAVAGQRIVYERIYSPTTRYQGFMWQPAQFGSTPAEWKLNHIVLGKESGTGGYLIFAGSGSTPHNWTDINLNAGKSNAIWPESLSTASGVRLGTAASPLLGNPGGQYVSPVKVTIH